jgi:hypothetical protein
MLTNCLRLLRELLSDALDSSLKCRVFAAWKAAVNLALGRAFLDIRDHTHWSSWFVLILSPRWLRLIQ